MKNLINNIICGDAIEEMKKIPDGSVDMILCDLPYGTTKCRWDTPLPLDELWEQYLRVTKERAAIVLTASQPFTSVLICSNLKHYRYNWVWEKSKASGYLNAKRMPLKAHEEVCIFYKKPPIYNPQFWESTPYNKGEAHRPTEVYGKQKSVLVKSDGQRYPRSVQYFKTAESEGKTRHATQKPLALFEYMIETYTNPGDLVLDSCIGSGTTAVAAKRLKRNYIGIDKDPEYVIISKERLENTHE